MAFNATTGNYESLEDTGYSRDQIQSFFNELSASSGAPYQQGDAENLIAKLVGGGAFISAVGGSPQRAFDEFRTQYNKRGASVAHRTIDSSQLVSDTGHNLPGIDPRTEVGYGTDAYGGNAIALNAGRVSTTPSPMPNRPAAQAIADTQASSNVPANTVSGPPGPLGYASYSNLPAPIDPRLLQPQGASMAAPSGGMNPIIIIAIAGAAAFFLMKKK